MRERSTHLRLDPRLQQSLVRRHALGGIPETKDTPDKTLKVPSQPSNRELTIVNTSTGSLRTSRHHTAWPDMRVFVSKVT